MVELHVLLSDETGVTLSTELLDLSRFSGVIAIKSVSSSIGLCLV